MFFKFTNSLFDQDNDQDISLLKKKYGVSFYFIMHVRNLSSSHTKNRQKKA